jgi:hypothetical protein
MPRLIKTPFLKIAILEQWMLQCVLYGPFSRRSSGKVTLPYLTSYFDLTQQQKAAYESSKKQPMKAAKSSL